jgi:protein-tyrosine phosphatase
VADPWYTDDFETAYRDIEKGCEALKEFLKKTIV